jgi:hypothetical protein
LVKTLTMLYFVLALFDKKSYLDCMSPTDFKVQRLSRQEARKFVSKIVNQRPENIRFSRHAIQELSNDDLATVDALNVLKSPDAKIHHDG